MKSKAHQKYILPSGEVVPGVTTILNVLNKPALVPWAWKLGRDGIDLRKAQSQAMDIGTLTHSMIESYLKNEKVDTSEYSKTQIDTAETAFLAFLEWIKGQTLSVVDTEIQMIHTDLRYGGTADLIAMTPDIEYYLIDFKTSQNGACYPEYRYQISAYKELWEHNQNGVRTISKCIILALNKETGIPTPHIVIHTDIYFEVFKHCLGIYNLKSKEG